MYKDIHIVYQILIPIELAKCSTTDTSKVFSSHTSEHIGNDEQDLILQLKGARNDCTPVHSKHCKAQLAQCITKIV